jgi:calcineurin-like phosphoesterase family protein
MHKNICRGTTSWGNADGFTRDFDTLDQMNDRIVNGINSAVGQDDILFHLGDWSFGGFEMIEQFRNRINCKNIHIILGNHDHHIERDREGIRGLFTSVNQYLELEVKGKDWDQNYVLMHYPIISWNKMNDGVIHLHGHVHLSADRRIGKGKTMDVGVDGNGLNPLHTSDIKRLMKDQPIKSGFEFDHHIKRFV